MRESDLTAPVRAWLESQGYSVYFEQFGHDIIGVRDGFYVVVELKAGMTRGLLDQCIRAARWADEVWACTPLVKTGFGGMKYHGIGVLMFDGKRLRVRTRARRQPHEWHKARKYRTAVLAATSPALPHHLAGLPCCPQMKRERQERSGRPQPTLELSHA